MKKNLTRWLQKSSTNPRSTVLIAVVWVGILLACHAFLPTRPMEARVVAPMLFKVREVLGRAPDIHPTIKVFGFDDVTAAKLERVEMNLEEWSKVLKIIDKSAPKAIIVDGLFSLSNASKTSEGRAALELLKTLKTPVYTGLFASPQAITGRVPLDLNDPAFALSEYLDDSVLLPGTKNEQLEKLALPDYRSYEVYGAHSSLRGVFRNAGHILYGNDEGSYEPFLRLRNGKTLPHLMFRPFSDVKFVQDHIRVEGADIYLSKDGTAPINFPSLKSLAQSVNALAPLVAAKDTNATLSNVSAGDYVYVIPLFHTGNTDFKPSPIGLISGGFAHLAILNSILQKNHLHAVAIEPILIVGFAAAIAYFGWWMGPASLILSLLAATLFWMATCIFGFVYESMVFPFLLPEASLMGVGISLLLQRIYIAERKARMIRTALEGVVRPEALRALQRNPEMLSLEARERVVTIVFIDIVGFSLMVENQLPRVAFEGLQSLVEKMTNSIHKHGGIVNKTLGDGLLCFFGYSLEDNKEVGNHAEEALTAALEIQQANIPLLLAAEGTRNPVFPLRIGINTSAVFMGNLGAGERLDITVIGNGVNFAKRLEAACLPHAILVGSTTYDLVRKRTVFGEAKKRAFHVKHHEDSVEAWEFDPLSSDATLRTRVESIYQLSADAHRRPKHWDADGSLKVEVHSEFGIGDLQHFSSSGLRFVLDAMIVRGTLFEANLSSPDGILQSQLLRQGINLIKFEVIAIESEGRYYSHNVRFVNLNSDRIKLIAQYLELYQPKNDVRLSV
ncbi:MAG: adenylate/guanylate cyclase domain-containing protein [Chitinophagaceae bacterium]|nr:adenylate/guanylate cyclase domain-containing protein [Oligoflexus sp.]